MENTTTKGYDTPQTRYDDYTEYERSPTTQIIRPIPGAPKVRCPEHGVAVSEFCMTHMSVRCPQCQHQMSAECVWKSLYKEIIEVHSAVHVRIEELIEDIPSGRLAQEVMTAVKKRFGKGINDNLGLLSHLEELGRKAHGLSCCMCQRLADYVLDVSTFEGYCASCLINQYDNQTLVTITAFDKYQICQIVRQMLPYLLWKVNFSDLTLEMLDIIVDRSITDVKVLQNVAKQLLLLGASGVKGSFQTLPDSFYCPECRRMIRKVTCSMRILPCTEMLHAICTICTTAKVGDSSITCPLDQQKLDLRVEGLVLLRCPSLLAHAKTRPEVSSVSLVQYPAHMRFIPVVPEFNQPSSEVYQGNELLNQEEVQSSSQSLVVIPPEPNTPKVPGTPLPPVNLPDRVQYLNRFHSVLPILGTSIAQMDGNNKGWHVNVAKNHVDAVTMTAFDSCAIIGLGLATPISPGVVAIVDSVTMYNGAQALGQPIFTYNGHEQLIGGNQVISYVTFRSAFQMPCFQKVTMKVKITGPPGVANGPEIELYRGNPFERPQVWCGSDYMTWEFEETPLVGDGEFANGQNNLSGPILRIIYQRT